MSINLSQRYFVVEEARREITGAILDAVRKHDLTYVELLQILTEEIASNLKYMLRIERHGDTETGGDEAPDG